MSSFNQARPSPIIFVGSNFRRNQQSRIMSSLYGNKAPRTPSYRNFFSSTSSSSLLFDQFAAAYPTASTLKFNQTSPTTATNTTKKTFRPTTIGGFDVTGEDIQKRLNSVYRRRNKNSATPQIATFQGCTIPEEELIFCSL